MSQKPNMTVTSRHFEERRPISARQVPSPFPNPPPNRQPIARLSFRGPSPKLDCSPADLIHAIGVAALPDAVLFLDTNVFTKELDASVWNAFFSKRILITPDVYNELRPWLKTPFHNKAIRDRVIAAIQNQVRSAQNSQEVFASTRRPSLDIPNLAVLLDNENEDFTNHGYGYYLNLLALRKMWGPHTVAVLTKQLGKHPTNHEFVAEVQRHLGARGLLLARKGLEAENSANKLTDEHLVVTAVLTAIMRGKEVFIVTRDPDVFEQYVKILCLMKEHYRAMLVAERYAASPNSMPFREIPVQNDAKSVPPFSGSSVLQLETTDLEFNPLPTSFHFVIIYCFLLAGEGMQMKLTSCSFCAETEMAQVLKVKARTGGLSTDRFNGRNCTIRTELGTAENHRVTVSIGTETMIPLGDFNIGFDDFQNTLFENEQRTSFFYDDVRRSRSALRVRLGFTWRTRLVKPTLCFEPEI